MWIEDESDGPRIGREATGTRELASTARLAVYVQMLALIPIVLVARSEQWGYAKFLRTIGLDDIARDICIVLSLASFSIPVLIVVSPRVERQRQRLSWAALAVSIAFNVVQVVALLPAVS